MASTTSRRITRKPLNAIVRRRVSALLFLCISALFFFAFVRVFYAAKNGNGRRDGDDALYVKFELQKQGEEGMKESSSHAIESAETTSSSSTSNETIDVEEDVLDGSGDDDGEQRNKSRSRESRSREECETSSRTVALNTEYAGDVVHWGDTNIQDTSKACCEMCYETKTCNVWVYNPQTKKCWLKKQKDLYEGVQPGTMATGWQIVWTSGTVGPYLVRPKDGGKMEDIEETEGFIRRRAAGDDGYRLANCLDVWDGWALFSTAKGWRENGRYRRNRKNKVSRCEKKPALVANPSRNENKRVRIPSCGWIRPRRSRVFSELDDE